MKIATKLGLATVVASACIGALVACGSSSEEASNSGPQGSAGHGNNSGNGGSGGANGGKDAGSDGFVPVGDGGPGGSSPVDEDAACAGETTSATRTRANILFLVDRTGSMNCNPPPVQSSEHCATSPQAVDPVQPTKWHITRDALIAAVQGLRTVSPKPAVGIAYFNTDDYCDFPRQPLVPITQLQEDTSVDDPHVNALVESLQAVKPKGETPIIGTTISAYDFLYRQMNPQPDDAGVTPEPLQGTTVVVLLTDGAETCDERDGMKEYLVQKAQEAAQYVGVRTFVLGAPGSEGERAFLSQIAFAGGTASQPTCDHSGSDPSVGDCHMDMTLPGMNFGEELNKNLQAITGEALTCEFDVPAPEEGGTVDYTKVNVKYSSGDGEAQMIPQDNTTDCSDPANQGWQYSQDKTKIILCGEICETVRNDNQASISIQLGCETVIIK